MPKILQINTVVNSGSTGRIAEQIGEMIISYGWDSYIAYGRETGSYSKSTLIKIGDDLDFYIHALGTRIFDMHAFFSKSATIRLIKQIKLIDPDLIHLHNVHGYYLNVELLFNFLSQTKIPVVWTLHDCWAFTGHCAYFDRVGCNKWKTICSSCPELHEYPASYFFDNSKSNFIKKNSIFNSLESLTLIPVSNWLSNLLEFSFLSSKNKFVIHNGIDLNVFKSCDQKSFREHYNLLSKFIVLGIANVWNSRKGLNDFIELSKILNSDFKIVLVGLTANQIKSLPKNILAIERTNDLKELIDIYTSADVFLNPTYDDNFPTTNLESLSCGTPVVTYETGGSPEALDNNCGFVVPKGSINGLVEAINIVKLNGKSTYSHYCRSRVFKFFNQEIQIKKYLEVYHNLLQLPKK